MLIRVGTIVRAHGVRGEMKVRPDSDEPGRLLDLTKVVVGRSPEAGREYAVNTARLQTSRHGITVLMALADIHDRDSADALRGLGVYASDHDLPPLDDAEWFLDDLVGMEVTDARGSLVGRVMEILDLPAHPTFLVARPDGSSVMVPAVAPFLSAVKVESRTVEVELPDGLLDT